MAGMREDMGITALIVGGVAIYEYTTAKSKARTKEEEALAITSVLAY